VAVHFAIADATSSNSGIHDGGVTIKSWEEHTIIRSTIFPEFTGRICPAPFVKQLLVLGDQYKDQWASIDRKKLLKEL